MRYEQRDEMKPIFHMSAPFDFLFALFARVSYEQLAIIVLILLVVKFVREELLRRG